MRDVSGAAIPNVTVTAVMNEQQLTLQPRSPITRVSILFHRSLLPGHYQISFQASGFEQQVRAGLELTVGQDLRVDGSLAIGSVQTKVDVSATAPLVDTVPLLFRGSLTIVALLICL